MIAFDKKNLPQVMNVDLVKRYQVVPLATDKMTLHLGMENIRDSHTLDAVTFHTGYYLQAIQLTKSDLMTLITQYCHQASLQSLTYQPAIPDNETEKSEKAISHYIDAMLADATLKAVSDIHIEPAEHDYRLRYRIDGLLHIAATLSKDDARRMCARLKVLAKLDVTECRIPQDGSFKINKDTDNLQLRLSTCPTLFGEKIVLRLLSNNAFLLNIAHLGMNTEQQNLFTKTITRPQGLILVTGPTGSGKTVTLYSALNYLNTKSVNIATIEDPIEIHLPGINQITINPKIQLGFAVLLRTLLRQDPDILMIGEIRDEETAKIAVQSAQTGHLVFSTLHANNATEVISRLQSLGVSESDCNECLTLVIAQRLARKLCIKCRKLVGKFYHPQGCQDCHAGFKSREGIYELLPFLSQTHAHSAQRQQPSFNLAMAAQEKLMLGLTSPCEIQRVLGYD